MEPRPSLFALGLVLASAGLIRWALLVSGSPFAWAFWAIAAGSLLVAATGPLRGSWKEPLALAGWSIAAVGGVRLLVPLDPNAQDFVALLLFTLGPVVAAIGSLARFLSSNPPLGGGPVAFGAALASLGGMVWVWIDIVHGSFEWANVAIALGYAIAAASFRRGRPASPRAPARAPDGGDRPKV